MMWRHWFVSSDVRLDVARGVAILDAHRPGWRNLVDVKRLDMLDPKHCVLGQVFGGYNRGLSELSLGGDEPWRHGFVPYSYSRRTLGRQWKRVVRRGWR